MNRICIILLLLVSTIAVGQTSEKYNSEYAEFYKAEDLYEKEQYGSAKKEFREFIDELGELNNPMQIEARYYEAMSALMLYNNDALKLLQDFITDYPETIYKNQIYFELGRFYYRKKKYDDALVWFNKLTIQDIEKEDRDEFYFKIGYSYFKEDRLTEARNTFHEIKDGDSQYASPALYYYSHIAYQNKEYQLALDGFLKLQDDPNFGKVVPYYIAQIYHLQGNYEAVTEFAPKVTDKGGVVNKKDINHLIGDAYYRVGKYDEAIPYLQDYFNSAQTTRDEDYQLGFSYYKSGQCEKAIRMLDRVKKVKDSLGQVAYYHIGECLLKLGNKVSARSAFEGAAFIEMDKKIQEDALYNYAILSYQLDINPYSEAVEAFELYLRNHPNSSRKNDVYQYLVNVYISTNNHAKALASMDKIANKDNKLKTAYQLVAFNQGVSRFEASNFNGAISSFKLVERYPVDPMISARATYWTADAYYRMNKFDDAISHYKKFTSLPNNLLPNLHDEAYYNIGYAYLNKKDRAKTIEYFRLFTQADPKYKKKKADAFMRVGDAYFTASAQEYPDRNEQAIQFYQKAFDEHGGFDDQALYYMGLTHGYNGEPSQKIKKLLDILNNYTDSKYVQAATFEVANTYNSMGNLDRALNYYKKIVFDYPNSDKVIDSKISIADIYFKQGNADKAEKEYRAILEQHGSDQAVCAKVTRALQDLFIAVDRPDKVESLVQEYACADISAEERENIYYLPAMTVYTDSTMSETSRYTKAIPKFATYLEKFPNGRYSIEVKNYLANCYYNTGNEPKAVEFYRETLEGPTTGFTVLAASRVSHYLYNEGRFEEVLIYYERMEQVSSDPETIFTAQLGLMRSHYQVENYMNAVQYADKVLENNQLSNELTHEAYFAKGFSYYKLGMYNQAYEALNWVRENTTKPVGSEAHFAIAESFYKRQDYTRADEEITNLLKRKPAYNFWIAKGLILRSRVQIAQVDLFAAEENLRSVRDHYPNTDDGVMDEANELWAELMQLKDAQKDIQEEEETEIEINQGTDGQN